MNLHIVTLFPEMFQALNSGIVGRALNKNLLQMRFWNPRAFTHDKHQTVDDRPYGGGPGMVMKVSPLRLAIQAAKQAIENSTEESNVELKEKTRVIYLSPQGKTLKQQDIIRLSQQKKLIFLAGRYEGVDQRLIDQDVDEVWSVGDYIVSGGELPIMIVVDAMVRLLPEVLNDPQSAHQDSFSDGLLEYPQYTRPPCIDGQTVPDVLLKGDHQAIAQWRNKESLKNTWQTRPDLLKIAVLNHEQKKLLDEVIHQEDYHAK